MMHAPSLDTSGVLRLFLESQHDLGMASAGWSVIV
jgi:hypothetical protein